MTRTLRIGTRGSALALAQATWVADRLSERGVRTELVLIRTEGDDRPADTAWGEGAFVGRIVAALLGGSIDLAVHSAKDVPTDEHPALTIAAFPPREDPRDALVCRDRRTTLATLPMGARVGTDSPRRAAFLRALRPDLQVGPLHGNVDTRLTKLDRGDCDALILAVAGLARLGHGDRIDEVLPSERMPSAPGQGSLAIQVRSDDDEAREAVGQLDDPDTRTAVEAERALLKDTGGGCRSPIGAIGRVTGGRLELLAGAERTWRPTPDASIVVTRVGWTRGTAPAHDAAACRELAARLAERVVRFRSRPRILTTRPAGQSERLVCALDIAGVDAANVPGIETVPASPGGALDAVVGGTGSGTRVVITSANAAAAVLDAAHRTGIDPRRLRWAAVGATTAAVLEDAGLDDVFVPSSASGVALARELPLAAGEPILLPRADIADRELPAALRSRGAAVTEVMAYRTLEAPAASRSILEAALDGGPVDALLLTSGSSARGLLALATSPVRGRLLAIPVIAIGQATAQVASSLGWNHVLAAPSPQPQPLAAFVAASLGVLPRDEPLPAIHATARGIR